jgi:hypothetical protein
MRGERHRAHGWIERARGETAHANGGAGRARGEVTGRITIVQEDRIRVVEGSGRGYLFVVRRRAASHRELERWRDERTPVRVRYTGSPDAGALAERLEVAGG